MPRLVIHVDKHASLTLADYFKKHLPKDGTVLDLMSSFRSHLPNNANLKFVYGLGLNKVEMQNNLQLSAFLIHDLNMAPNLPFRDNVFDSCLISFSIQYLVKPVFLMVEVGRILRPSGMCHIAFSNRMFATKAVAIWQAVSNLERGKLIESYFDQSKMFDEPRTYQLVEPGYGYDPLFVVRATRNKVDHISKI